MIEAPEYDVDNQEVFMNEVFSTHPLGSTPGLVPMYPQCIPASENCEIDLQIGIFFDGTGNNQDWDDSDGCEQGLGPGMTQRIARKDSNVARLFRAYPEKRNEGKYPLYIPGVGTPFPDIGEDVYASFGPAMGRGGDGRINYALLGVLNVIHASISSGRSRYVDEVILALCRNGKRGYHRRHSMYAPLKGGVQDVQALDAVGMRTEGGLLCDSNGARAHAEAFFQRQTQALADKIANTGKPKLVDITLDVFGFSRGAAQARVFCNWLLAMMDGDRLCGVRTRIRFLGLFDTVASVGIPNSSGGDGHFAWASAVALRVPGDLHCVHYTAMHENRASFPLESLRGLDGILAGKHRQYALPGMHSDIGGGYLPGSQGRGPSGLHDDMLSQIPLALMYEAAREAQVPLDKDLARDDDYDPFAIHPNVLNAYTAFMKATPAAATTAQSLLPYLAWRYQVRDVDASALSWVARTQANFPKDFQDLEGANQTLLGDIAALDGQTEEQFQRYERAAMISPSLYASVALGNLLRRSSLASEAKDVLAHLKAHPILGTPENPEHLTPQAYLFANYTHDSYAGFRPFDHPQGWAGCVDPVPGSWEPQGYLRYRRVYRGTGKPVILAPPTEAQRHEAAQRERDAQLRSMQNSVDMNKLFNGF